MSVPTAPTIFEEAAQMKEQKQATAIIDNVEALEAKMTAMREAQKVFATYTQE